MTTPVAWPDRASALAFILAAQADPATATAYLGDEPDGLEAELEGLAQPWLDTLRVVPGADGLLGACAIEWDEEAAMAWVQGPWVVPDRFDDLAADLVGAVLEQCPPAVRRFELFGDVANTALARLAGRLGWLPTPVSHAYLAAAAVVASWPEPDGLRVATPADQPAIEALHAAEFGASYATAGQLVADYTTLVADLDGRPAGYAAGNLQADGQAYVDFMAVEPGARRHGLGRRLLCGLGHRLVQAGQPDHLHLTVSEERAGAVALYESLGMRRECSLRGYRSPTD